MKVGFMAAAGVGPLSWSVDAPLVGRMREVVRLFLAEVLTPLPFAELETIFPYKEFVNRYYTPLIVGNLIGDAKFAEGKFIFHEPKSSDKLVFLAIFAGWWALLCHLVLVGLVCQLRYLILIVVYKIII